MLVSLSLEGIIRSRWKLDHSYNQHCSIYYWGQNVEMLLPTGKGFLGTLWKTDGLRYEILKILLSETIAHAKLPSLWNFQPCTLFYGWNNLRSIIHGYKPAPAKSTQYWVPHNSTMVQDLCMKISSYLYVIIQPLKLQLKFPFTWWGSPGSDTVLPHGTRIL